MATHELGAAVYFDGDVAPAILRIFQTAQQYVVAVTPYTDLWEHLKTAVDEAQRRQVEVYFLVQRERNPSATKRRDLEWMQQKGVRVKGIDNLHAKIYFNENDALLCSMNLTQRSAQNAREVAYSLPADDNRSRLRLYVRQMIEAQGSEIDPIPAGEAAQAQGTVEQIPAEHEGCCIRCGTAISLNQHKPLCGECHSVWAKWRRGDYMEKFCHKCGQQATTSFNNPTCYPCFSGLKR